jgi:dTDP-4-dehydrorhamnose 3,5-epimerase
MNIQELDFKGVYQIKLESKSDDRGFFVRSYDKQMFIDHGLTTNWLQESHAYSKYKGILRGLHLQLPPFTETKLIMVVRGAILDVFVDLRPNSPTFGKWDAIELSEDNFLCLYLPRGFAHSYCTLQDGCDVVYKMDNLYNPHYETGIIWKDSDLNIKWPVKEPTVSAKDMKLVTLKEFMQLFPSLDYQF